MMRNDPRREEEQKYEEMEYNEVLGDFLQNPFRTVMKYFLILYFALGNLLRVYIFHNEPDDWRDAYRWLFGNDA